MHLHFSIQMRLQLVRLKSEYCVGRNMQNHTLHGNQSFLDICFECCMVAVIVCSLFCAVVSVHIAIKDFFCPVPNHVCPA